MTTCILTAEADLRSIIRYTPELWGTAQVRRYIARLEHDTGSRAKLFQGYERTLSWVTDGAL